MAAGPYAIVSVATSAPGTAPGPKQEPVNVWWAKEGSNEWKDMWGCRVGDYETHIVTVNV